MFSWLPVLDRFFCRSSCGRRNFHLMTLLISSSSLVSFEQGLQRLSVTSQEASPKAPDHWTWRLRQAAWTSLNELPSNPAHWASKRGLPLCVSIAVFLNWWIYLMQPIGRWCPTPLLGCLLSCFEQYHHFHFFVWDVVSAVGILWVRGL